MQISFFYDKIPLYYKYDNDLGIVLYCSNCGKVTSCGNICECCGSELDRNNQIHNENKKVKW